MLIRTADLKHNFSWRLIHKKREKIRGEPIWKNVSYFGDEKADVNIEKKDFPENALCYVNQGYLSTVKNGGLAIYNNNFMLPLISRKT